MELADAFAAIDAAEADGFVGGDAGGVFAEKMPRCTVHRGGDSTRRSPGVDRGDAHADRLATLRMRSMTMAPSMLSVGGRVDDSAKPLRRYTEIAGSIAPRSVWSQTV